MQINQHRPSHLTISAGRQASTKQALYFQQTKQRKPAKSLPHAGQGTTEQGPVADQITLSFEGQEASKRTAHFAKTIDCHKPIQTDSQEALSNKERQRILELQRTDREVRAHEQAHLAKAGPYAAGGMTFTYAQGPDGKRYAIGGEVPINMSEEATPEETAIKMQTIQRAALAPVNPSAADRMIATQAAVKENIARMAMRKENDEEPSAPASARTNEQHPQQQVKSSDSKEYRSLDVTI